MVGASDAGAHLDMIDTFTYSTSLLGPGVRAQREMASAATPMRRPAFKDITNGVGRVEGEDLLDLTTAELKNQWKLRGIKGHSKLSGDVKGALVKALWPDAPSRPVAPSTTKRKRSENIFRVAHNDELLRESHEQLVKRIRTMEDKGREIWKQSEA